MRGSKTRSCAMLVGLLLGLCSGNTTPAWAQGKGPQSGKKPAPVAPDPVMTDFDKHVQAGNEAINSNRWEAARQEFLKAHELKPDDAETVAQLVQAEIATERNRDAVEHLELFLAKPGGNDADRKMAERLLAEARSKLAIVTIKVDKPGAKVSVDGRILGTSPLADPVLVDSGHRRFEAEGPGGQARLDMDLEPGTKPTVNLVLKAPEPKVIVKESPSWRTPMLLAGLGIGVVGLGIGTGFSIAASGKHAEAMALGEEIRLSRKTSEELCPPIGVDARCTDLAAFENRRDTYANVALAGFVVGGAVAAGTLIVWLTGLKKTAVTNKKEGVLVVPSPNGVFLMGTF